MLFCYEINSIYILLLRNLFILRKEIVYTDTLAKIYHLTEFHLTELLVLLRNLFLLESWESFQ